MNRPRRLSRAREMYEDSLSTNQGSTSSRPSRDVPTYKVSLGNKHNSSTATDPYAYFTPRNSSYVYDSSSRPGGRYSSSSSNSRNLNSGWVEETISYSKHAKRSSRPYSYEPKQYSSSRYYDSPRDYNSSRRDYNSPRDYNPASSSSSSNRDYRSSAARDFEPSSSSSSRRYNSSRDYRSGAYDRAPRSYDREYSPREYSRGSQRKDHGAAAPRRDGEKPSSSSSSANRRPAQSREPPRSRSRRGSNPYRQEIYKLVTQALSLQDQGKFAEAREIIARIEKLQAKAEQSHAQEQQDRDLGSTSETKGNWDDNVAVTDVKREAVVQSSPRSPAVADSDAQPSEDQVLANNAEKGLTVDDEESPKPKKAAPVNVLPADDSAQPTILLPPPPPPTTDNSAPADDATDNADSATPSDSAPAPTPAEMPPPMIFSPVMVDDSPVESAPRPVKPRKASVVLDQVHAERMLEALKEGDAEEDTPTLRRSPSDVEAAQFFSEEADDDDDDDFSDNDADREDQVTPTASAAREKKQAAQATMPSASATPAASSSSSSTAKKTVKVARSSNEDDFGVPLLVAPPEEEEVLRTLVSRTRAKGKLKEARKGLAPHSTTPAPSSPTAGGGSFRSASQGARPAMYMITKEGFMRKSPPQRRRWARWRDRYFILSGRLLVYFKTPTSKAPQGIINLDRTTVTAVRIPKSVTKMEDRYEVRVALADCSRTYRFICKTKRQAIEWTVAITNNVRCAEIEGDVAEEDKRPPTPVKPERARAESKVGWNVTDRAPEDDKLYDFYTILGVQQTATPSLIKKNYYKLARDFHPDKNPDANPARFADINRAFHTLKDTKTRDDYDLCERVKSALRRGVLLDKHEKDGTVNQIVLFIDAKMLHLYWQNPDLGTELAPGYGTVEVRFIQQILAGLDGWECPPGKGDYCLSLVGERMGCPDIRLESDTPLARDELLDGMRILRVGASKLFEQKLDEMRDAGMR